VRDSKRLTCWLTVVLFAALIGIGQSSAAEAPPKHGGTLEFASTVEPGNYDCHGNTSFAFLHPVAPHYSTLLKFDTANYPQIIGDLAERIRQMEPCE
jgi:peptide/nickel transport system substrate-binding protein